MNSEPQTSSLSKAIQQACVCIHRCRISMTSVFFIYIFCWGETRLYEQNKRTCSYLSLLLFFLFEFLNFQFFCNQYQHASFPCHGSANTSFYFQSSFYILYKHMFFYFFCLSTFFSRFYELSASDFQSSIYSCFVIFRRPHVKLNHKIKQENHNIIFFQIKRK